MRLRYGFAELVIVQPGLSAYAAAPPADSPHVQRALALARERHGFSPELAEGMSPREVAQLARVYDQALHPERLQAPPPLAVDLALTAAETALASVGGQITVRSAVRLGPPLFAALLAADRLRTSAERRSARRLGVTAATAPQLAVGRHFAVVIGASVLWRIWRIGRPRAERRPWTLEAAAFAVRRFNTRRSWLRAYAAALNSAQY